MRHYTCILLKSILLSCDIFFHFWMATVIMLVVMFGLTIVVCNVAYVGFSRCKLSRDQKNLMKELWHNSWVYVVNQSHFFFFWFGQVIINITTVFLYQEQRVKFVSYKMNICWSNLRKIFVEASCLQGNNHFPSASAKKKFVIIMLKMSPHFFPWSIPRFQFLFFHFL